MKIKNIARMTMLALPLAVLFACEDKTGLAEEFAIITSNSVINIDTGERFSFNAQVIDRFQNPLPSRINAVSEDPNIVAIDSVTFDTVLLETRVFGRGVNPGQGRIVLTSQSLTDTVVVNVAAPAPPTD